MDEPVELGIAARSSFRACPRLLAAEQVLHSAAEPHHVPQQVVALDRSGHARFEALAEGDHPLERLLRQHLAQRRPHRGQRQHVRGQRAADSAHVRLVLR